MQSSTLYANNVTKFLTSLGPFTTQKKGELLIDHERDPVVRGALVFESGNLMVRRFSVSSLDWSL